LITFLRLVRLHLSRGHTLRTALRQAWDKVRSPDLPVSPTLKRKP
jgi:hypothetical protein